MKTDILNERTTPTHSTSIEVFRRSKAIKRKKVMNVLPAEIKEQDLRWGKVLTGGIATFSIFVFFASLLFLVLVFGAKF